jgi:glycosyltransferase involved in cell wall biosynthesis
MKILLLAPHPFYQERGSPIAVNLLLRVLSARGDEVDALVYHEGEDIHLPNVSLYRVPAVPFIRGVPPGLSWKKLVCDTLMFFSTMRLMFRGRYDLVYSIEEAVFISAFLRWITKTPYVYDMDSRLSEQLCEANIFFKPFRPIMRFMERNVIRNARMVVPVCDGLLTAGELQSARKVVFLRDVSLLGDEENLSPSEQTDLRSELGLESACLLMYVGNLQPYQGIDLLLEGFALAAKCRPNAHLIIIGGAESDISKYTDMADRLGIGEKVHFTGPKPIADLKHNLAQADILVSPRIKGNNTPMKLYSYLHSGTACVLTDLPTHRQVASENIALFAKPSPQALHEGLLVLIDDEEYRERLAATAKDFIDRNSSLDVFEKTANELFDWLQMEAKAGDQDLR